MRITLVSLLVAAIGTTAAQPATTVREPSALPVCASVTWDIYPIHDKGELGISCPKSPPPSHGGTVFVVTGVGTVGVSIGYYA
jgi:hypothetical protein